MSQDIRLYNAAQIWDQPLQLGQRNLLQAIRDFLPKNVHSLLDVGCGDGKLTSKLLESEALTIVGLDSSEEALSRLPFPGVRGDAQALPFPEGAFDAAMSTDALEHMPDDEEVAAWNELFRVASKAVIVAVPFREELLDASACCSSCGYRYHVNWHQRSYDLNDLWRRAPEGWSIRATVLAGEPWNAMLPPETRLRRYALNEWAGWELAMCPSCGAAGQAAPALEPLPTLLAASLAEQLYPELAKRRYCRSHSEILVVFQREGCVLEIAPPPAAEQREQLATCVDFTRQPAALDLQSFCQVAQHVAASDGGWRIQFPLYEPAPLLEVCRLPGSREALHLVLEDAIGCLYEGCVLAEGVDRQLHELPRQPFAGYYGILASCSADEPFASIRLGQGPAFQRLQVPASQEAAYMELQHSASPLFIQVSQPLWFDSASLECDDQSLRPEPERVLRGIQESLERMLPHLASHGSDSPPRLVQEVNQLQVHIQNLNGEREGLLERAREADRLAVDKQNLVGERDALLERAREADQLAVERQNLVAERDALLERAREADQLAVERQNLVAERDALLERAREADQLAVERQNLVAERDALLERAREMDQLAVENQNLLAERAVLLLRAAETDQLAVDKQNLLAERDALLQKAYLVESQAVRLQNLEVELEILHARVTEADRLSVEHQNLTAGHDALLQKALLVDVQAVKLQNLAAERDTFSEQAALAEQRLTELSFQKQEQDALQEQLRNRLREAEEALRTKQNQQDLYEAEKQSLEDELRACRTQLEKLSQHFENRLGAITRRLMKALVKDK
ncbi:methyltransferase domain-containing protein [Pseudomonas sp. EggHat1]|uniref:methyltransferase domain-containing protein n=1 Tax=Pseudomonas sp. EggHat1 TaxID=2761624 RepID=UPI001866EA45|nr:class I SAM-dependent methyltransferase [Pseudomonas sp. EggHat1]